MIKSKKISDIVWDVFKNIFSSLLLISTILCVVSVPVMIANAVLIGLKDNDFDKSHAVIGYETLITIINNTVYDSNDVELETVTKYLNGNYSGLPYSKVGNTTILLDNKMNVIGHKNAYDISSNKAINPNGEYIEIDREHVFDAEEYSMQKYESRGVLNLIAKYSIIILIIGSSLLFLESLLLLTFDELFSKCFTKTCEETDG